METRPMRQTIPRTSIQRSRQTRKNRHHRLLREKYIIEQLISNGEGAERIRTLLQYGWEKDALLTRRLNSLNRYQIRRSRNAEAQLQKRPDTYSRSGEKEDNADSIQDNDNQEQKHGEVVTGRQDGYPRQDDAPQ